MVHSEFCKFFFDICKMVVYNAMSNSHSLFNPLKISLQAVYFPSGKIFESSGS